MIGPDRRSALEVKTLEALSKGPLTAKELAAEIGCADDDAYMVLSWLRADQVVKVDYVRLRGKRGAGRGASVYSVSRLSETR